MRPAFFAADAIPFFRKYSIAFSMSASHSTSAVLHSAMPAPERSRSSLIICGVMLAILFLSESRTLPLLVDRSAALGAGHRLGLRQVATPARNHLDPRALATRRHANRLSVVRHRL